MRKTVLRVLSGVPLVAVVVCWFRFQAGSLTGGGAAGLLAWGRLAGLLAAFGVLFQLLLIGRVRWIERAFGFDRLARLHHGLGFALILLLALHPALVTAGYARLAEVGCWAQAVDFCQSWRGLLSAVIGLGLMALASVFSLLVALRRVRYECWYATHLTLYAAFALTFLHQVAAGSDLTDHPAFRSFWYALYAFVLANFLAYRFVRPLRDFARHRFVVTGVVPESDDVTSVVIGGRDLPGFRVEAGQFMMVRFLAKGFWHEAHPFSLSCYPDGRRLRLTVKRLGDFTRRVAELKPGTPVLVDGPHGALTAGVCASDQALLIAGGIGITPLRALAEEFVARGRDVTLLYGSRTSGALVFRDELDALAAGSSGRFRAVYVLSGDPAWPGERGHVDRERLARLIPDLLARDVYVCGPPAMMKAVVAALSSLGVRRSRIHVERFAL